jgi:hypothetical protein
VIPYKICGYLIENQIKGKYGIRDLILRMKNKYSELKFWNSAIYNPH